MPEPGLHTNELSLTDLLPGLIRNFKRLPKLAMSGLSVLTLFDNRFLSMGRVLEYNAQRFPDNPALMFEDRVWTYQEFNKETNRLAYCLKSHGLQKGDVVAVFLENRPETLLIIAALAKLGATASLINFNQREDVLEHSMTVRACRAYCIGTELIHAFDQVRRPIGAGSGHVFLVGEGTNYDVPGGYIDLLKQSRNYPTTNPVETTRVRTGDHLAYVFTSGTTGMPKASIQTHKQWLRSLNWFGRINLDIQSADVIYVSIPFFHANALMIGWASAMSNGAAIAMRRKFSVKEFWDDIRRFQVTCFIYIGEICRYLFNAPEKPNDREHRVRKIIGNGMRPDVWDHFKERFGIEEIIEFYGASDSNIIFTNTFNADKTVGWSPASYELVAYDHDLDEPVRDEKGFFSKVGKGETGLLIAEISRLFPFPGYVNQRHNDSKVFKNVFKKGDEWFNTGDLMRDIGLGHVQFVDRVGDTFRWKGENVATAEVEQIINLRDDVAECAVYGIQIPECDGRAGMVAVVERPGATLDLGALAELLQQKLPVYARPVFLRKVSEFERTPTQKIKKSTLKKEGFEIDLTELYVSLPGKDHYELVNEKLMTEITAGAVRF